MNGNGRLGSTEEMAVMLFFTGAALNPADIKAIVRTAARRTIRLYMKDGLVSAVNAMPWQE
jgi:hypothetical protein